MYETIGRLKLKFNGTSTGIDKMKTLLVLVAIAAVVLANPIQKQNYGEGEIAKVKVEVGGKCSGSKCSGNINVKGDWFETDDGTLVRVFEPIPAEIENYGDEEVAKVKVEVGGSCSGSKCSGHINVGGDWFKANDGTLVRVLELVPTETENYGDEEVAKVRVEVGGSCSGSKCSGHINVGGDWFLAKDGSLIQVLIPESADTENYEDEEVAKVKVEVGGSCSGSKCSGHINVGGDWFQANDGTLVPIWTPVPANTELEVEKSYGPPIKAGINWLINKNGYIVAVPSEDSKFDSELSCNAGHCINRFQLMKNVESGVQENKEILVDWFKSEDGSLVGIPRPELAKTNVNVGVKCHNNKCSGSINVGGDWFVAGDGTTHSIPKFFVAESAGSVVIFGNAQKSEEFVGIKIKWFEGPDGNLIPEVVPQPAGGDVTVGGECHGSKCSGNINVRVDWFVASNGAIVITPQPAKSHITGGIECHGSKCSGHVGVGVDWFKNENNIVRPIVTKSVTKPEDVESYGKQIRVRGGIIEVGGTPVRIPVGPVWTVKPNFADEDSLNQYRDKLPVNPIKPHPKDWPPRVIHPKSYNLENENSLNQYRDKLPVNPIKPHPKDFPPRVIHPKSFNA